MKQGIHPDYHEVVFMDSATGYKFLSGSTKNSEETIEWEDGNTYPLIRVEISSDSTQVVKSLHKQTDVWIVSTRNTVSQTKIVDNLSKTVTCLIIRWVAVFL